MLGYLFVLLLFRFGFCVWVFFSTKINEMSPLTVCFSRESYLVKSHVARHKGWWYPTNHLRNSWVGSRSWGQTWQSLTVPKTGSSTAPCERQRWNWGLVGVFGPLANGRAMRNSTCPHSVDYGWRVRLGQLHTIAGGRLWPIDVFPKLVRNIILLSLLAYGDPSLIYSNET